MGYEYCIFFPSARVAVADYVATYGGVQIPSNVCPALATATMRSNPYPNFVPVDSHDGMAAGIPVQLYGFREIVNGADIEIDPLMTGAMGPPFAPRCIVSFGRHKTISLGAGGALLTNEVHDLAEFHSRMPEILREPLSRELDNLHDNIQAKWLMASHWDKVLGDCLPRIPRETKIPWRTIRRVPNGKRDAVVKALRTVGLNAGTNYPALTKDESAIKWGSEVINLWGPAQDAERAAVEIMRVMYDCD